MPLGIATCIVMVSPVCTAVLAQIFLGEKMSKYDVLSSVFSFIGVILINNPLQPSVEDQKKSNYFIGTLFALSTVFAGGFIALCMRYLKDIHCGVNGFYWALGSNFESMLMYSITLRFNSEKSVSPTYDFMTILLLTIESIIAVIALVWMSRALQLEKPAILAPFFYIGLPL